MNGFRSCLVIAVVLPLFACASSGSNMGGAARMQVTVDNQLPGRYTLQIDGQPVGDFAGSGETTLEVPRLQFLSRPVRICVHPVGATRQLICRAEGPLFLPEATREIYVFLRTVSRRPQLTASIETG